MAVAGSGHHVHCRHGCPRSRLREQLRPRAGSSVCAGGGLCFLLRPRDGSAARAGQSGARLDRHGGAHARWRRMGHALHRHAGFPAGLRRGLRHRPHRVVDGAGRRGGRGGAAGDVGAAREPRTAGLRCGGAGRRHRADALLGHGGHPLRRCAAIRPRALPALGAGGRAACAAGAVGALHRGAAAPGLRALPRFGDRWRGAGWRDFQHALHRHGGGVLPASRWRGACGRGQPAHPCSCGGHHGLPAACLRSGADGARFPCDRCPHPPLRDAGSHQPGLSAGGRCRQDLGLQCRHGGPARIFTRLPAGTPRRDGGRTVRAA